jgi:hypothetical protein
LKDQMHIRWERITENKITHDMQNTVGSRLPTLLIFVEIPLNVDRCDTSAPRVA